MKKFKVARTWLWSKKKLEGYLAEGYEPVGVKQRLFYLEYTLGKFFPIEKPKEEAE